MVNDWDRARRRRVHHFSHLNWAALTKMLLLSEHICLSWSLTTFRWFFTHVFGTHCDQPLCHSIYVMTVSSWHLFVYFPDPVYAKGGFFFRKFDSFFKSPNLQNKNIPNYYPELEIWICCLLLLGGNLNFKLRIVIPNIFFWRFRDLKYIALSEKRNL